MSIRVRFAPSPTGQLHIGGARTALFNYLFAKSNKGSFIIRIEDTDQERHQEEAVIPLLSSLKWMGLDWDEGPILKNGNLSSKGSYGPYRQKDRSSIYKEKVQELLHKNKAYYCFMSLEEERKQKDHVLSQGKAFRVSSPYRDLSLTEAEQKIQKGESYCIRFKTPEQNIDYLVKDLVKAKVKFPKDTLGDFVLIRADGFPVYNFSCAVDDALMEITHVFRGEEHLPNSLKQSLIQQALNLKSPKIGHLSIILGSDKKKLSKRTGSQSLEYYKDQGYLPRALMNYLALLGWNPGTEQEFFSEKDLIESFHIEGFNLSSAIFDEDKLLWLNEEHIKSLSDEELLKQIQTFWNKKNIKDKDLKKFIPPLRSSFKTLKQSCEILDLFFDETPLITKEAKTVLKCPSSKEVIVKWLHFTENLQTTELNLEDFTVFQKQIQKESQIKGKNFFMPLRCALMGHPEGIEIKILVKLLKKEQFIKRAKEILKHI